MFPRLVAVLAVCVSLENSFVPQGAFPRRSMTATVGWVKPLWRWRMLADATRTAALCVCVRVSVFEVRYHFFR